LLNQKFTPKLLEDKQGLDRSARLVRSYFKLHGHHIQFNVVTAGTLRAAQANPEKYRDLVVRVAGYSDCFCDLTEALQKKSSLALSKKLLKGPRHLGSSSLWGASSSRERKSGVECIPHRRGGPPPRVAKKNLHSFQSRCRPFVHRTGQGDSGGDR